LVSLSIVSIRQMSISVLEAGVTLLLKAIPVLSEQSELLEFAFGSEPVIKLIAWVAVTLKIDFIGAAPDFLVTWRVVCRSILFMRLNRTCAMLQSHVSLAFRCHTGILSSRI
jgi:hypothetical protein